MGINYQIDERGQHLKLNIKEIEMELARQSMTKAALAEKCGRSPSWATYVLAEDSVEPHVVGQLATGLGVPVEQIILPED